MADVRIQQYPQKSIVSDNDIFLIADSNDVDVNGFLKYKKVRAKDLPSIVNTAESITYANLIASIAADDLIIGTFYKITDSTSGVSPLLVQAVGVDAIGYLAFDAANPLVTINYDVITDTIRWSLNQTVAPISLGSLSATTPLSYNNTTGVFTISQSNTSTNGFLSSADWNTFTAKQNALSGTGIVKSTGGTISYLTDNSTNWNTAYNDSIVSAGVTGTSTKTLTLNQQDGGTVTASWSDADTGLTSVGLTMPSAFSVANSPLTSNGTLAVTGAGVASQYVRGDGTLAAFPTSTGGGSSVSYYFNGGTSQGTIGGNTYYEMSETAVIGTGADFNINANGYIAQFVTDANDPALLTIPAGNWNFEMWFSANSGGGSPSFYLELYKYDGATLTLISSGSAVPESITGGTAIDLYTTALAVPTTALTITDRLAVRVFVNNSSRTITLHTQNGHLCQAITTFSTGLTALNGLTNQVQYLAVGTSGTDFGISSATSTHTFNLPTASASNRGALSSADWTTFNNKASTAALANYLPLAGGTLTGALNGTSGSFSGNLDINGNTLSLGSFNILDSSLGYSSSYRVLVLSDQTANNNIGLNYNPISNVGGSFNGTGQIFIANNKGILAPNSAGDNYIGVLKPAGTGVYFGGSLTSGDLTGDGLFISTTGAATFSSSVTASSLIKSGGTSSQYLMADGSTSTLTNPITGTGTTNYLPKFTGASALGDSLVFDNGTNVGIGTPIPNNKLQISALDLSNIIGSSNASININNTGASFGNTSDLIFTIADGNANFKVGAICSVYNTYSTSVGGDLVFLTNNGLSSLAEKMRITSGGNVGIGTTTPSEELEVYKSQNGITRLLVNNPDTTNTNSRAAINVSSGSVLGEMVAITGLGLYLGASSNNFLSFITNGSSRMDITAGGNVLIATATDAGFKLDVNGTARVSGAATIKGLASTNGILNIFRGDSDTFGVKIQALNTDGSVSFESIGDNVNPNMYFRLRTLGTPVTALTLSGTGAATFSSSVTAADAILSNLKPSLNFTLSVNPAFSHSIVGENYSSGAAASNFMDFKVANAANSQQLALRLFGTGAAEFSSSVTMGGELLISTGADSGMRLKAGVSSLSYIDFADANTGAPQGSIAYNHIVDALVFSAGGSNAEKMRVKSNTINFSSLPTSSAGLSAGDIWNDSGTLKIV